MHRDGQAWTGVGNRDASVLQVRTGNARRVEIVDEHRTCLLITEFSLCWEKQAWPDCGTVNRRTGLHIRGCTSNEGCRRVDAQRCARRYPIRHLHLIVDRHSLIWIERACPGDSCCIDDRTIPNRCCTRARQRQQPRLERSGKAGTLRGRGWIGDRRGYVEYVAWASARQRVG